MKKLECVLLKGPQEMLKAATRVLRDESAQGTTEYAILVGVLVVTNNH